MERWAAAMLTGRMAVCEGGGGVSDCRLLGREGDAWKGSYVGEGAGGPAIAPNGAFEGVRIDAFGDGLGWGKSNGERIMFGRISRGDDRSRTSVREYA